MSIGADEHVLWFKLSVDDSIFVVKMLVGTAGDFVFVVVGFSLRVLDEMFVLVPLPSPPPEVTSVATGIRGAGVEDL
jgi:hypothetical protein